jgi:hypothetical protein
VLDIDQVGRVEFSDTHAPIYAPPTATELWDKILDIVVDEHISLSHFSTLDTDYVDHAACPLFKKVSLPSALNCTIRLSPFSTLDTNYRHHSRFTQRQALQLL